jgi:hypothetical protein
MNWDEDDFSDEDKKQWIKEDEAREKEAKKGAILKALILICPYAIILGTYLMKFTPQDELNEELFSSGMLVKEDIT